jgi:hypothetical protein
MHLKTRSKKVSIGILSAFSGSALQVKRNVACKRISGILKEKNISDFNGPPLEEGIALRSKRIVIIRVGVQCQ